MRNNRMEHDVMRLMILCVSKNRLRKQQKRVQTKTQTLEACCASIQENQIFKRHNSYIYMCT